MDGDMLMPQIDMELSIPVSPLSPRAARVFLSEFIDVSEPALPVAQLLLSEVLSESVRESRTTSNSPMRVRLMTDQGTIKIELEDAGFGLSLPPNPGQLSEESWALYLVSYLADQWGIDPSGNATHVWFEIILR
jgi:anti-sigma regulatory factor (Ser/Thr protein kinase)